MQELAAKAAGKLGLPVDQVAPYLLKREELGSTGIGRGARVRRPQYEVPAMRTAIASGRSAGDDVDVPSFLR